MSTGTASNLSNDAFWESSDDIAIGNHKEKGISHADSNEDTNNELVNTDLVEDSGSTGNPDPSPRQYRKGWRKPRGMPKRPMSSYNLFFQLERERLVNGEEERVFTSEDIDRIAKVQKQKDLSCHKRKHRKSHGKISFATLARVIADKWKALDVSAKAAFFDRAALEKNEYKAAVEEWARSSKDATQLTPLSPTPGFLAEPIESPQGNNDDLSNIHQPNITSPGLKFPTQMDTSQQEMWNSTNCKADLDPMMLDINGMDGSFMDRTPPTRRRNMEYYNSYQNASANGNQALRNMSSTAIRRQLQPRFALPSNAAYFEQDHMFPMRDVLPNGNFQFNQSTFSPSGVTDDIYHLETAIPAFSKYGNLPNQNEFDESDLDSLHHHHLTMMRRRSFAMGDRRSYNEAMFRHREQMELRRMQFRANRNIQSVPNLYYSATDYNDMQDWADMPLEDFIAVNQGQFAAPSMFPGVPRKSHSTMARRSTFSGGYNLDSNNRSNHLMNPNFHSIRSPNQKMPPQDQISDKNSVVTEKEEDSPPPIDVITIRRAAPKQDSSSYHDQDFVNDTNSFCHLSSSQASLSRQQQYEQDALLGSYIRKQHFPRSGTIQPHFNEDDEKAAIDLASLAGIKAPIDEPVSKAIFHHPEDTRQHFRSSVAQLENRDASGSNDSHIGLPINYVDDRSFHAQTWEV